jgi:hypothetical protein
MMFRTHVTLVKGLIFGGTLNTFKLNFSDATGYGVKTNYRVNLYVGPLWVTINWDVKVFD